MVRKTAFIAIAGMLAVWVTASQSPVLQGDTPNPAVERIRVDFHPEKFETTVTIRAVNGRIHWADLLYGLSRARGFDDSALNGVLPDKTISISGTTGRLSLVALNLALAPHLRCELLDAEKPNGDPNLVVTLDRQAMLASQRRIKSWLRENIAQRFPSRRTYGISVEEAWRDAPLEKRLVIFVHGLQSSASRSTALVGSLSKSGCPCGVFDYPNDQPLDESAALFARELRKLAQQQPGREICIVAHSMGGLVARAVVEDPQLDPGNVKQLIMLATPNQGSLLAYFAYGLDLTEIAVSEVRQPSVSAFFAAVEDGLADAQRDLRPDSPFLVQLNARPRNAAVRYTLVLGDKGPLTDRELAKARDKLLDASGRNRWTQFFGSRVDTWLSDLDEVVDGRGDGAVAVKRGRLEGVDDTVIVHIGHLDFAHDGAEEFGRNELAEILLERLK